MYLMFGAFRMEHKRSIQNFHSVTSCKKKVLLEYHDVRGGGVKINMERRETGSENNKWI